MPHTNETRRHEATQQDLAERLRARKDEIEAAVLARVCALADPREVRDPEYALGLKAAVKAAVSYGLSALEHGAERLEPIPAELLSQARRAARAGIGLDTVLRRYVAGHTLFDDFIVQEAETVGGRALTQCALRAEGVLLDRLIEAGGVEYRKEAEANTGSSKKRRTECVKRLLAGELVDVEHLNYEFQGWHLGLVGSGAQALEVLRDLAAALDRRLLLVHPGGETIWAWIGGRTQISAKEVISDLLIAQPSEVVLAFGEPGAGLSGWRLTHRQGKAAYSVATRGGIPVVSYPDVAIIASILDDEILVNSLTKLYIAPLTQERDGGIVLRETLKAYFAARRNAASAAAALGVSRQTVTNRLHAVEEKVNCDLSTCATEIETALRIWELEVSQAG